jgi:hypothetical protein
MQRAVRQADEASLRAEEVRRSIEVGDVQPRPLPSLREDSIPSMGSMKSMKSIESSKKLRADEGEDYSQDYGEDYGTDYGYGQDYGERYGKDR